VIGRGRVARRLWWEARALERPVRRFYRRADALARKLDDHFSLDSATRPAEMATLLRLATGRAAVVELGTATAWTSVALALADDQRRVISYDPVVHAHRDRYVALGGPGVAGRLQLRATSEAEGPRQGDPPAEMVFVDSTHDRDSVLRAVTVWRPALAVGAVVAFHDYDHPDFPGVRAAIHELRLPGQVRGGLFVWMP
jgi:predicted O-methyltransferase YrrM